VLKSNLMNTLQINTDGGSRGNPGPAGIGVYATIEGKPIFSLSQKVGINTNNYAEYAAVIAALEHLKVNPQHLESVSSISFVLDSELVVRQLTGVYKVKHPAIVPLHQQVKQLVTQINLPCTFSHVLRTENKEADRLVNLALDS
jgi:ribonuclease HI